MKALTRNMQTANAVLLSNNNSDVYVCRGERGRNNDLSDFDKG